MARIRRLPPPTTALLTILALCAAGWGLFSTHGKEIVPARRVSTSAENSPPATPPPAARQGSENHLLPPDQRSARIADSVVPSTPLPCPPAEPKRMLSVRSLGGQPLPDVRIRLTLAEQAGRTWLTVTGPDGLAAVPDEVPVDVDDLLLFEHEPGPDPVTGIAALPMRLLPMACAARELGPEAPHELTAERALGVLPVKVLKPTGEPLPEARLWLCLSSTVGGEVQQEFRQLETDERGEVAEPLYESDALLDGTLSLRRREDGLLADPLQFQVPTVPQQLVLRCYQAGALLVEVVGPNGEPVTGVEFFLNGPQFVMARAVDSGGHARFENLATGDYVLRASPPGGGGNLPTSKFHLQHSERRTLELTLPATPDSLFVVGGRLIDEEGRPVIAARLGVSVAGGLTRWVHTSEEGRFSFQVPAGSMDPKELDSLSRAFVSVRPRAGVFASRFSPRLVHVPIGTRDLEFRRLGTPPAGETVVELLDAHTGARVVDPEGEAMVTLYRPAPGGERIVNWASYGGDDGLVAVEYYRHPDVWLTASLPGYKMTRQPLTLTADGGAKTLVRVQLERGFGDDLVVRGPDRNPVSGAEFLDSQGNVVGITDLDGRVSIRGRDPQTLTVHAPGFAPEEWYGGQGSVHSDGTIWLNR